MYAVFAVVMVSHMVLVTVVEMLKIVMEFVVVTLN